MLAVWFDFDEGMILIEKKNFENHTKLFQRRGRTGHEEPSCAPIWTSSTSLGRDITGLHRGRRSPQFSICWIFWFIYYKFIETGKYDISETKQ